MSLKGSLNSVDLANIFQMLSINQKEGTLNIFDGQSQKSIYFSREGVSMLSRGKPKADSLGRILMRFDQLSRDQLDRALGIQKRTAGLLGSVLEENEILPREVVEDALRLQIEEEIYSLFIWKDAEFEFIEGSPPEEFEQFDGDLRKLTFNVNSLIMEAARRIDEWTHIEARVATMDEIYRYTGRNMDLVDPIFQEPFCDKVLASIDGKSNVEDLIQNSYVNKFEVCKILSLCIEQGAIEPVPADDLGESAEEAINLGEIAHAIKFLRRIIDLGQDSPKTHQTIANAYQADKEFALATKHFRKYAEASARNGSAEDAFTTYLRLCELIPTDLDCAERLIELFAEHAEDLEEHREQVVKGGASLATMLIEINAQDRAIATLKRVCGFAPEDIALRHLLVKIYLDNGHSEQAQNEYQSLVDRFTAKREWVEVAKLLRKMLAISPDRQDLHHRLEQVLTRRESQRKRLRRVGWITLAGLILGLAGFGYLHYNRRAQEEIALAEGRSTRALINLREDLERTDQELILVSRAMEEGSRDPEEIADFFDRAERLHIRCLSLIRENVRALGEISDRYKLSTGRDRVDSVISEWQDIGTGLEGKLTEIRRGMHKRSRELAASGKAFNDSGRITKALTFFRNASRMAVGREPEEKLFAAEIARNARLLEEQVGTLNAALEKIRECCEKGDYETARNEGIAFLVFKNNYALSEIRERTPVPLRVESEPSGALIHLNGEPTGVRTPGWVNWSPGVDTRLTLQLNGFVEAARDLPPLNLLATEEDFKRVAKLTRVNLALYREPEWSESVNVTVDAQPAPAGDGAYVVTRRAKVLRVSASAHRVEHVYEVSSFEGIAAAPCVQGHSLFLATIEGRIEKVDLRSGRSVWRQQAPGRVYAPLSVDGGKVFVGDSGGHVSVHDASTGSLMWRRPVPGEVLSRPVHAAGTVLAVSTNGRLYVHAIGGGERLDVISPEVSGDRFVGSPCVSANRIYVSSNHGWVSAFDLHSRRRVWRVRPGGEMRSGPDAEQGVVLAGSIDGKLYAIRDGQVRASTDLGGSIISSPTIENGVAYVANDAGLVLATRFGADRLEILWRVDLAASLNSEVRLPSSPVMAGHRVLVVTEDGTLFLLAR